MDQQDDPQCESVFDAELRYGVFDIDNNNRLQMPDEVQVYVNKIVNSDWWRCRSKVDTVNVTTVIDSELSPYFRNNIGDYAAFALCSNSPCVPSGIMSLRHSLSVMTVIHELAHIFTPRDCDSHGKEFCHNYIALVRKWIGKRQSNRLRYYFRSEDVEYKID